MQPLYFVERSFSYPIERIWKAWTDASELEKWYCPVFLEVIPGSATSDLKVGGSWAIGVDVSANGFNAYFWGSYKNIELHKNLTHDLCYSQDELEFALRQEQPEAHIVSIDFEDFGTSCKVRFSQFGKMDPEQAEASREGMESYFDNLETYLGSSSS